MEKDNTNKINFFKKVWYSISKFEKYPDMAAEGIKSAIKYLVIIVSIVTVFISIGSMLKMKQLVGELAQYINDNIPEFVYEDGKLSMEIEEPIIIDNINYDSIDKVVINPLAETDEDKEKSKSENEVVGTTIFFFKDQIIVKNKNDNNETQEESYTYNDFIVSYTQESIDKANKSDVVQYMTSEKMYSYYSKYVLTILIYLIMMNIVVALLDTLELAVLGWITSITARVKMNFAAIYNMAVYSLTLSMILNLIYVVINYFTEFTIQYFQVAYITIAYIYLAASIFLIKDDFMKKKVEVDKIKEEQQRVREEMQRQEEKKQDNKEENEKRKKEKKKDREKEDDDENAEEPKGSEA